VGAGRLRNADPCAEKERMENQKQDWSVQAQIERIKELQAGNVTNPHADPDPVSSGILAGYPGAYQWTQTQQPDRIGWLEEQVRDLRDARDAWREMALRLLRHKWPAEQK
jgi:uncharacterized protein (DUF2249 family)